jgi:hypothetical protein
MKEMKEKKRRREKELERDGLQGRKRARQSGEAPLVTMIVMGGVVGFVAVVLGLICCALAAIDLRYINKLHVVGSSISKKKGVIV